MIQNDSTLTPPHFINALIKNDEDTIRKHLQKHPRAAEETRPLRDFPSLEALLNLKAEAEILERKPLPLWSRVDRPDTVTPTDYARLCCTAEVFRLLCERTTLPKPYAPSPHHTPRVFGTHRFHTELYRILHKHTGSFMAANQRDRIDKNLANLVGPHREVYTPLKERNGFDGCQDALRYALAVSFPPLAFCALWCCAIAFLHAPLFIHSLFLLVGIVITLGSYKRQKRQASVECNKAIAPLTVLEKDKTNANGEAAKLSPLFRPSAPRPA